MRCLNVIVRLVETVVNVVTSLSDSLCCCCRVIGTGLCVCATPMDALCADADIVDAKLCCEIGFLCESSVGEIYFLWVEEGRVMVEEGFVNVLENIE